MKRELFDIHLLPVFKVNAASFLDSEQVLVASFCIFLVEMFSALEIFSALQF